MGQRFYARPDTRREWPNGAIGYGPGGRFDCLGPFAKVQACPVDRRPGLRLTCYATGYADTVWTVPACTRYGGRHVGGFLTCDEAGPRFVPRAKYADRLPAGGRTLSDWRAAFPEAPPDRWRPGTDLYTVADTVTGPARAALWDLVDYRVSSVSAGSIWLVPCDHDRRVIPARDPGAPGQGQAQAQAQGQAQGPEAGAGA